MPTYEYECDACGFRFEKFQSITAKPIRSCPQCRKHKAKRLISGGGGVLFKGDGFYQTDYRTESYRKAAEKDKPVAATSSEKPSSEKKTESPVSAKAKKENS